MVGMVSKVFGSFKRWALLLLKNLTDFDDAPG
jgi:hypothetical protein